MVYDINLVPKAKKKEGSRYGFMMLFTGIFCILALVLFFFWFPVRSHIKLTNQIAAYNEQLREYNESEMEYQVVADQLQQLQSMTVDIATLKEGKKDVSTVLEGLAAAMPKDMEMSAISAENGLLTLSGTAQSYKDISRFMVQLRKIDKVEKVTFTSAVRHDSTENLTLGSTAYDFTLFVQYEATVMPEISEQEAIGEQEGEP